MRFRRYTTLLGIAFEGEHITMASLRRFGDRVELRKIDRASLALDPLNQDPELVGTEIRNHLDKAGIRIRQCVVCVPLEWVFVARTDVPKLSEADTESYLNVQAEREFPVAPEHLHMAISRYHCPGGEEHATLLGIPRDRVAALLKALKAAKLQTVGITLGIASLLDSRVDPETGVMALFVGKSSVEIQVSAGGGVAVLRTLDVVDEKKAPEFEIDMKRLVRDIRITLGQLPPDLRVTVKTICLFGSMERTSKVREQLATSVEPLGLDVEIVELDLKKSDSESGVDRNHSLLAAVAQRLRGRPSNIEFLPARVSRIKQWTGQVSSRAALWLAGAAVVLAMGVGGAFLFQFWRLSSLETEWQELSPRISAAKVLDEKVSQYQAWFDDSIPNLTLIREVTEAFPEEGSVWAKSLSIQAPFDVSCSGNALNNREWLALQDRMRGISGVQNLQILQVRGDAPLQFTVRFRWEPEDSHGT